MPTVLTCVTWDVWYSNNNNNNTTKIVEKYYYIHNHDYWPGAQFALTQTKTLRLRMKHI